MKDLLLSLCRWLLPILGVSAVGCNTIFQTADEYGTPYADFEIKGKVTDASTSGPLQGIEVSALDNDAVPMVSVTTDVEGRFELTGSFFPAESIVIRANDIDGEENGGLFAPATITVQLDRSAGGDGWYSGKYTAEIVSVTLSPDLSSDW